MKYIECEVYKRNQKPVMPTKAWEVDKVLIFRCGTKDSEIESLPEEMRDVAYIMSMSGFTNRQMAVKYKHGISMGTRIFAWDPSEDFRNITGARHPVELYE